MNVQRKDVKKLGKDVEYLEKKLTKISNNRGNSIKNKPCAKSSKHVTKKIRVSEPDTKSSSKDKRIASVEVSVKTKSREKLNKKASTHSAVLDLPFSPKISQSEPHPSRECHCGNENTKISKNVIWSNLLKETPSRGDSQFLVSKDPEKIKKVHSVRSKNVVSERENESEELASDDGDVGFDSVGPSIAPCVNGKNWNHKQSNRYKANSPGGKSYKSSVDQCLKLEDMPAENVETLKLLVKRLHNFIRVDEDNGMKKLFDEIEQVLGIVPKTSSSVSEVSCYSKSSSMKSSARQSPNIDKPLEDNLDSKDKVDRISEQPMACTVKEKLMESQGLNNGKIPIGASCKASGDYLDVAGYNSAKMPKRAFLLGEKSDFPFRLMNDKDTQINLSFESEENVRDLDFLKKQLRVLQKSSDRSNNKDSEYHSLFTTLADKVKQLEDHVNEQTQKAQKFYLQSNALLGQNNIIPVLQTSQELLNKRLLESIRNHEKLKADYALLELEKEKYRALNDEKDKQLKEFKEELTNIQHLVRQQMKVVKNFVGFSSATDNLDTLLSIIDSQSNVIKSKLRGINLEDGTTSPPVTSLASLSPSSYSPISTAHEQGLNFQSDAIEEAAENNPKGFPADLYLLNVPELQSPHSS